MQEQFVSVTFDERQLNGVLLLPERAVGVVLFAHGAGDDYHGDAPQATSGDFVRAGLAALRLDQGAIAPGGGEGSHTYFVHADIVQLARQLEQALAWLKGNPATRKLPCALYGHGASAAVVMQLAAWRGGELAALAVCDGQVELAGKVALDNVRVPSLLIVSGRDPDVAGLNRMAFASLRCDKQLEQIAAPGSGQARHQAALLACDWYTRHFNGHASRDF
jgi:putative phosphoribosyl transferase